MYYYVFSTPKKKRVLKNRKYFSKKNQNFQISKNRKIEILIFRAKSWFLVRFFSRLEFFFNSDFFPKNIFWTSNKFFFRRWEFLFGECSLDITLSDHTATLCLRRNHMRATGRTQGSQKPPRSLPGEISSNLVPTMAWGTVGPLLVPSKETLTKMFRKIEMPIFHN